MQPSRYRAIVRESSSVYSEYCLQQAGPFDIRLIIVVAGGGMPAGSSELCVRIVHHASRTSIAVQGELDLSNRSVLRAHLQYVISDAPGDVELDLGGVAYIDSCGLVEILDAHAALLEEGRDLHIVRVSRQVATLFEVCGISHLLDESAISPDRSCTTAFTSPSGDAAAHPAIPPTPYRVAVDPLVR